jgi:hypothetical protein
VECGREDASGLRSQRAAQVGKAHPQVVAREALAAVGPEGAGEPGALDLAATAKHEQRQEPALSI